MSVQHQLRKIESLYSANLKELGSDNSRAVGWNTEGCQKLRFSKLMQVVGSDSKFTINDLGCGYGALLDFIVYDLLTDISGYTGSDISSEMISAAKKKVEEKAFNIPNIVFKKESKLSNMADYSVASGIFNVKFDADEESWKRYVKSVLVNLYENSYKGFSFNVLTSYVDWKEDHLYYADPRYWFDFCKVNFSNKVNLIHDYPLYEWTIIVKK